MIKFIKNIFVYFIVLGICLLLLDRFVFLSEAVTLNLYEYNNRVGKTLIPGSDYLFTSEGMGMGSVNKDGYLGKPSSDFQNKEVLKIALIGDSYVESYQLFDRMYFGRIMETELRDKYGINAEVMNFGRSGFMLSDMFAFSENFVKKFNPDLILYFIENEDLTAVNIESGIPYPYKENDSIHIYYYPQPEQNTFFLFSLNQMSKYFPLVQMVSNAMNLNKEGQTPEILFGKFYEPFSPVNVPANNINTPDSLLIDIINNLSQSEKNVLVYRGKENIDHRIYSVIKGSGVRYIDVNDTLNESFNPYYWKSKQIEGHWNISAHDIIGKFLAGRVHNSQ